jgi:hypothetical protein
MTRYRPGLNSGRGPGERGSHEVVAVPLVTHLDLGVSLTMNLGVVPGGRGDVAAAGGVFRLVNLWSGA